MNTGLWFDGTPLVSVWPTQRAARWASGASGEPAPGETKPVAISGVWRPGRGTLLRNPPRTQYRVPPLPSPGCAKWPWDTAGEVRSSPVVRPSFSRHPHSPAFVFAVWEIEVHCGASPLCFSQSGPCSSQLFFFSFFSSFRGFFFPTISLPLLCGILQKYNLQVSSMAVSVSSCQLERFLQYPELVCQANIREVDGISLCAHTAKGNV